MEFDLPTGMAVLQRTPAALRSLLEGLPDAWTMANEGPDTWSPYEVVGHLLHGEHADWMPRVRTVLAGDEPRRFAPVDRTAHLRESRGRSLAELLDAFAEARARSLAELRALALAPAQLELRGEHPAFGPVTLRQLLATWVAHDLAHLAQVSRTMAKQYRDAVGPWRAYLAVMDR